MDEQLNEVSFSKVELGFVESGPNIYNLAAKLIRS